MVKVSIIGATGYTGRELVRILHFHPEVEIDSLTAKIDKECLVSDIFPIFKGIVDLKCKPFDKKLIKNSELVFLAVPHGVALELVSEFLDDGKKVIDLSADYRLENTKDYKQWYNIEHSHPDILNDAVYGLSEFNRGKIENADLIANPGCFPTSILLALLPVIKQDVISLDAPIIIDSKTGTTGAGRKATLGLSFSEIGENIKPYKINRHQHTIEIVQQLSKIGGSYLNNIVFVPHLVSFKRGILNTIYIPLKNKIDADNVKRFYLELYEDLPFVKIFDSAEDITVKDVVGTNKCHIGIIVNKNNPGLIVISAIDNLIKGAAGQAVQNMNIMYGFDEKLGLL